MDPKAVGRPSHGLNKSNISGTARLSLSTSRLAFPHRGVETTTAQIAHQALAKGGISGSWTFRIAKHVSKHKAFARPRATRPP